MSRSGYFLQRLTRRAVGYALMGAIVVAAIGCGGKGGKVTGKVTYQGKDVTGGSLTFSPAGGASKDPGKPATGTVGPDGSFTMGTDSPGDGAVAGRHRVSYTPPEVPLPEGKALKPGEYPPKSPYHGLVPKDSEVEVKSGPNTINIELVPGKK